MMQRPLDGKNLGQVARLLVKNPSGRRIMEAIKTKTHEEHLVLCAPATLARCVAHAQIDKSENETLRILLINVKMVDFLDAGQWYRFVPPILGKRFRTEVVANTTNPTLQRSSLVPNVVNNGPRIQVRLHTGTLSQTLVKESFQYDLAIGFNHQLGGDQESMAPFEQLARANIPVYLCDTSAISGLMNRTVSRVWGMHTELIDPDNRFGLVKHKKQRMGERWGSVISRMHGFVNGSKKPDEQDLNSLNVAGMMMLNSLHNGFAAQIAPIGARVSNGEMLHAMDGIAVKPNGEVWDLIEHQHIGTMPEEYFPWIQSFDDGWDESDRFIWGTHVTHLWRLSQDQENVA